MLDQCHPVAQNHFKPILSRETMGNDGKLVMFTTGYHWGLLHASGVRRRATGCWRSCPCDWDYDSRVVSRAVDSGVLDRFWMDFWMDC
jgi:hypothetical protein